MLFFSILLIGVFILPLSILLIIKYLGNNGFKYFVELNQYLKNSQEIFFNTRYLFASLVILILSWVIFNNSLRSFDIANFYLHFFGGGVITSFIFLFFVKSTTLKVKTVYQFILLYFFASGLGVASEMLEFTLQSITNIKYTSAAEDTWRDLLANTLGAFLGLLIIKLSSVIYTKLNDIFSKSKSVT